MEGVEVVFGDELGTASTGNWLSFRGGNRNENENGDWYAVR